MEADDIMCHPLPDPPDWCLFRHCIFTGNVTPHPHTKYRAPPSATVLKPFKAIYCVHT
ncbi:hypothetical protein BDU57DRAFT_519586 [Ampelomyces quisqualis]|uniref:Uncharacterized protein n=1 Tax=Ampelomyces quisqualis TaxID=50730 RepID=A0A6A5QGK6_AMPQU|nr:hypothetical protein BDU57DRAFT_519586 [Ampelomyces quisqualis]